MNTTPNTKKKLITSALAAAAAAVATPALLFVGAGTAQADSVQIYDQPTFGGVTMTVDDISFPASDLQWCYYTATPPVGLPYVSPPFELNASTPSFQWFVPSLETHTTWAVQVACNGGGAPQNITFPKSGNITY